VASLWDVYDQQTTGFMEAFYRHLSTGKSKAEALRAVKLDLIGETATSAPRHWAGFILMAKPTRRF
jgi:CHAT domain-containing protein